MSDADDLLAALLPVASALQRLGVPFYVGGSVASTFHGAIRSTFDVDVICDLRPEHVDRFLSAFGSEFYVSETAVRAAVEQRSCFNLIHLPTAFKVDMFVSRNRSFERAALDRAMPQRLAEGQGADVPVATAEDVIVAKLEWFRLGDESSERQWDDVARLVALLGSTLDLGHMRRMAAFLGVEDLLAALLSETGP